MLDTTNKGKLGKLLRNTDMFLTFGLFGTVFLLVLPVPPAMMDLLLAISIGMSLMILLVTLYVKDPSEFSVFPTILLAITLFRLGLNVASTRLILLDGYAGQVIDTFGNFVVRGNFVVGLVVFLILVVINFIVITKGSGRIAEVAARFTLDSMPGKQMSIDAELNAGTINEQEANRRRQKVQKDADFYGSMDGASKFVRGDAIAGILITLINIVGGILIGVFQKNLPLMESLQKYTLLSIGDGLVSQVPSLIISMGAGILITRSSESTDLGTSIGKQLFGHQRTVSNLAIMLGIFAFIPGMPSLTFLSLAALMGFAAYVVRKTAQNKQEEELAAKKQAALAEGKKGAAKPGENDEAARAKDDFDNVVTVDAFTIELGYGLLALADRKRDGDLIDRITGVRRTFAREVGILIPPIAIRDNLELETNEYRFLIRGKEIARSSLVPNRWLAMNVSDSKVSLRGIPTVEPVFNLDAVWIQEDEKKTAEVHGYTVVDPASVLITHLSEILRENSALMLEREDVQHLIDMVKAKNPTLISELLPDLVNVGVIQRVLQNLLKERIPIKNLSIILETIADYAGYTKNPDELSEFVRRAIGMYFVQEYETEPGVIHALTLEPRLEQMLAGRVKRTQFDCALLMDPQLAQHIIAELNQRVKAIQDEGGSPVLVTTQELRLPFKRFFEPSFPRLSVLAYQEIPNKVQLQNAGIITTPRGLETNAPARREQIPAQSQ
ncbi:MAG: flagellar biosynthesis protein FlhA [Opitutales bacterium]|nr:flagellar biosynthesis protein FlhA [Opitutales bacterium]